VLVDVGCDGCCEDRRNNIEGLVYQVKAKAKAKGFA